MVKSELEQVKSFSITTDMWSSRSSVPFMGLTVHWIDEDFKLRSRALEVSIVKLITLYHTTPIELMSLSHDLFGFYHCTMLV